jgi:alkylation response protein AidB-like acyl-CoA dehydrogenase
VKALHFSPTVLTEAELSFREEVRAFLADQRDRIPGTMLGMSGEGGYDPEFSRRLGERGWLGLTLSRDAGGHGRTYVERFVLTEELLAAQAPVSAHWFGDRQSAPLIARYGTPEQKARFVSGIVAGETYFSIGMSEPDVGSDLARVRTSAVRVEGGWSVSGTKVWTTLAHRNRWLILLCRTDPAAERHAGLSQLIVDLTAPGVSVRPIESLDGEADFSEIVLTDVFVPQDCLLGTAGHGWEQVVGELAFERSGPDRYLSAWPLFAQLVGAASAGGDETIGRLAARYRVVRELALSLVRSLDAGQSPVAAAAAMKDIGTVLEQDTVEAARLWLAVELDPWSTEPAKRLLARAVLTGPTFTLRGGTTEILRGIVTRAVAGPAAIDRDPVFRTTADLLRTTRAPARIRTSGGFVPQAWSALAENGLTLAGVPEDLGGSGGTIRDAVTVVRSAAGAAAPLPVAETAIVAAPVLAAAGLKVPPGPLTVAVEHDLRLVDGLLTGPARRVPFASAAELIVAIVDGALVGFRACGAGRALSGEPREDIALDQCEPACLAPAPLPAAGLRDKLAAARAVQIAGALRSVLAQAVHYTSMREQFGQPLIRHQAVAQQIAVLAECAVRSEAAAELATRWIEGGADREDLMAATLTARESATTAAKIAHQVHGAIGVAAEYDLQLYTRRLWTWRDEGGDERSWAVESGRSARSVPDLWRWISR